MRVQVVLPSEAFSAVGALEGFEPGVDELVLDAVRAVREATPADFARVGLVRPVHFHLTK